MLLAFLLVVTPQMLAPSELQPQYSLNQTLS